MFGEAFRSAYLIAAWSFIPFPKKSKTSIGDPWTWNIFQHIKKKTTFIVESLAYWWSPFQEPGILFCFGQWLTFKVLKYSVYSNKFFAFYSDCPMCIIIMKRGWNIDINICMFWFLQNRLWIDSQSKFKQGRLEGSKK